MVDIIDTASDISRRQFPQCEAGSLYFPGHILPHGVLTSDDMDMGQKQLGLFASFHAVQCATDNCYFYHCSNHCYEWPVARQRTATRHTSDSFIGRGEEAVDSFIGWFSHLLPPHDVHTDATIHCVSSCPHVCPARPVPAGTGGTRVTCTRQGRNASFCDAIYI